MMSILKIYWMGQYRKSMKMIFSFSRQKEGGIAVAQTLNVVGRGLMLSMLYEMSLSKKSTEEHTLFIFQEKSLV